MIVTECILSQFQRFQQILVDGVGLVDVDVVVVVVVDCEC